MKQTLQEGRVVKVPAEDNKSWLPSLVEGARAALRGRKKRLDKEEEKANSYAKGGLVKREGSGFSTRRGYGKARGA